VWYGTIYRVLTAYSKGSYVALVARVSIRQVSPDVLLRTCHTASVCAAYLGVLNRTHGILTVVKGY
jgi:hypothetical protein